MFLSPLLSLLCMVSGCTTPVAEVTNPPESMAPDHVAMISFSTAMDQDSVLESVQPFHPKEELKGYFAWQDKRNLQYFLETPKTVKSFSIIFQKPIQDLYGQEVETPTKLDFYTEKKKANLKQTIPKEGAIVKIPLQKNHVKMGPGGLWTAKRSGQPSPPRSERFPHSRARRRLEYHRDRHPNLYPCGSME